MLTSLHSRASRAAKFDWEGKAGKGSIVLDNYLRDIDVALVKNFNCWIGSAAATNGLDMLESKGSEMCSVSRLGTWKRQLEVKSKWIGELHEKREISQRYYLRTKIQNVHG